MPDFSLALPQEICLELGHRARAKRIALNLPAQELAARIGLSDKTLRTFEQTGRCNLETFVRILEVLNALPDLQKVLAAPPRSIDEMRQQVQVRERQRAYRKSPLKGQVP
jgi:transcriptional regulator with XRE-family HTH domain